MRILDVQRRIGRRVVRASLPPGPRAGAHDARPEKALPRSDPNARKRSARYALDRSRAPGAASRDPGFRGDAEGRSKPARLQRERQRKPHRCDQGRETRGPVSDARRRPLTRSRTDAGDQRRRSESALAVCVTTSRLPANRRRPIPRRRGSPADARRRPQVA